jgi:hypothetical protein
MLAMQMVDVVVGPMTAADAAQLATLLRQAANHLRPTTPRNIVDQLDDTANIIEHHLATPKGTA